MKENTVVNSNNFLGLVTLSLRWVVGWTYFSAFWRRLVLENKLIPEEAGYIGEKFNHFLPNALGIKPFIEYLVSNPDVLQISMVAFTLIEAVVGLFIILGLFTRLMSIGVFLLALGILLGSGWIGTTCLDEWQIGILGLASGFTIFLTGSGAYSFDTYLQRKSNTLANAKWFKWLASGELPLKNMKPVVLFFSVLIFALSLYTNQIFHGGVFGKLHNKSIKPKVEISNLKMQDSTIKFQLFRGEGADVYGSFLIGIEILDENKNILKSIGQKELSQLPKSNIKNHYVAKIKPGKHSLVIPLGAKADITLSISDIVLSNHFAVKLIDISGAEWVAKI